MAGGHPPPAGKVVTVAVIGDAVRSLGLSRDHLNEFRWTPSSSAITDAAAGSSDEALRAELLALLRDLFPAWLGH